MFKLTCVVLTIRYDRRPLHILVVFTLFSFQRSIMSICNSWSTWCVSWARDISYHHLVLMSTLILHFFNLFFTLLISAHHSQHLTVMIFLFVFQFDLRNRKEIISCAIKQRRTSYHLGFTLSTENVKYFLKPFSKSHNRCPINVYF